MEERARVTDPVSSLIRSFYNRSPWWVRVYLLIRHSTCPFEQIETRVPANGKILDAGCGFGAFAIAMAAGAPERKITAVDWQAERIAVARKASSHKCLNVTFLPKDIDAALSDSYDVIVLVDVIYLFSSERKRELLEKCFRALSPKGKLLIKEMDTTPPLKYFFCLLQEFIATRMLRLNGIRGIHVIASQTMKELLGSIGFSVDAVLLDKGYCHPHILYCCEKQCPKSC